MLLIKEGRPQLCHGDCHMQQAGILALLQLCSMLELYFTTINTQCFGICGFCAPKDLLTL
jgi:hypothetical protein